jgi:tRNA pseudouridine55 synthase
MFGCLNIDKPRGMTSRQVVDHVQRLVRPVKAGHAGTLDPLATGVLVVCVGPATRLVPYLQQGIKGYLAQFLLGCRSNTEDVQGEVTEIPTAPRPSDQQIRDALPRFVGAIWQRPPDYSALKVAGKRAYELAREGKRLQLQSRQVQVHQLEIVRYQYPELELRIECGSGTYVRSLGRDLAEQLGTHAVMSALCRSRVGRFQLDQAKPLSKLDSETITRWLLPPTWAFGESPCIRLTSEELQDVLHGRMLIRPGHGIECDAPAVDEVGRLIAVVAAKGPDRLRPVRVFPAAP